MPLATPGPLQLAVREFQKLTNTILECGENWRVRFCKSVGTLTGSSRGNAMASAKQDFERFIAWLHQPEREIPSNVRRLANLALANFDALAQTSRHRSQRSAYLAGLVRPASDEAPIAQLAAANGAWPWRRLRHLALGPFRGFRTPEPFDLQKRIILFYGPNGTGKTSFSRPWVEPFRASAFPPPRVDWGPIKGVVKAFSRSHINKFLVRQNKKVWSVT